jgi:hypothetical protein
MRISSKPTHSFPAIASSELECGTCTLNFSYLSVAVRSRRRNVTESMRKIGGTLAAGCSIILKPSEETPGTAIEIAEAFHVNGFTDAVKDHSGIKIIDSQLAYFSQEKAQTLMENYIAHYGNKIDGVFSVDSGVGAGALSAVQAAEAEGKLKKGHVQMVDATIFGGVYDAIKAGDYYGSVVQSPEDDAKTALRTAVMAAEGMSVPKKVFLPMPIVTSATIGNVARPSF